MAQYYSIILPTTTAPAAAAKIPISTSSNQIQTPLNFNKVCASHHTDTTSSAHQHLRRRDVALGLIGVVVVGLNVNDRKAMAAGRRPPPPPPKEKKDPSISGVTAKVLASKKRKEAMKESIAKLREKGKQIQDPTQ
ncbi:hypothetical protein M9H77_20162 [Catharanthus roseus]|uniref:Uncharacterized protein n=1 Tax=Catharanthus roseus TaxID=4058 RepID=A0ACC0AL02_CATRO|nr:hypothetical protein M9H77_20162 [Catharanthus roseus]